MHYLDDDLELVDGLSDVFREQCSELQGLDKQAEQLLVQVKSAKKSLLDNYANLGPEEKSKRTQEIKSEYKKIKEIYSKKYELSCELEQLIGRVNNKVKTDVHDFRYELEMENPGCTFELEKRFCEEFDRQKNPKSGPEPGPSQAGSRSRFQTKADLVQRRVNGCGSRSRSGSDVAGSLTKKLTINTSNLLTTNGRLKRGSDGSVHPSPSSEHSPTPSTSRSTPRSTPAPISPAIRRQSNRSSFAEYGMESVLHADFNPQATIMPSFAGVQESRHGRPRKLTSRVQQMLHEQKVHRGSAQYQQQLASPLANSGFSLRRSETKTSRRNSLASNSAHKKSLRVVDEGDSNEEHEDFDDVTEDEQEDVYTEADEDMPDDTEAKTYCICDDEAHGDMVMCDNEKCPREWFHFTCVGLAAEPPGKWYCHECRTKGFGPPISS